MKTMHNIKILTSIYLNVLKCPYEKKLLGYQMVYSVVKHSEALQVALYAMVFFDKSPTC